MTSDVIEAGANSILDQMITRDIAPENIGAAKSAIARAVISAARTTIHNEAIEEAAQWLRAQVNALSKLNREPEKKVAFLEAYNAILSLKRQKGK